MATHSSVLAWMIPGMVEPGGLPSMGSHRVGHDRSDLAAEKVALSCPSLCDPMDYTVHGILQARIVEWVAFPFPRGSSQPRNWTQVSCNAGRFFTSWATREAQYSPIFRLCTFLFLAEWLFKIKDMKLASPDQRNNTIVKLLQIDIAKCWQWTLEGAESP